MEKVSRATPRYRAKESHAAMMAVIACAVLVISGLYPSQSGGMTLGGSSTATNVVVSSGLFTAQINFGPIIFSNAPMWIEIAVRTNSSTNFLALAPRQPITPVPRALLASQAITAESATIASGVLPNSIGANGIQAQAITGNHLSPGAAVKSLNGLTDHVSLVPGTNMGITKVGNELVLSATAVPSVNAPGVPNGIVEYTNSGSYAFVPPAGVTRIMIEFWGAGGGGGGGNPNPVGGIYSGSGGAGGGGGYSRAVIMVNPGSNYVITIGSRGLGGSPGQNGTGGGNTSFETPLSALLIAFGGGGGMSGGPDQDGSQGSPGNGDPNAAIRRTAPLTSGTLAGEVIIGSVKPPGAQGGFGGFGGNTLNPPRRGGDATVGSAIIYW